MSLDLVTAARRHLAVQDDVTDLLGSDATYTTWIFRWRPYVSVEGSGAAMVVLTQRGSWASANTHNTMRFPRLVADVYADVERSKTGLPKGNLAKAGTAEEACLEISAALDEIFHLPDSTEAWWGRLVDDQDAVTDPGLRIIGSKRQGEPEIRELQGGDGVLVATNQYMVTVG